MKYVIIVVIIFLAGICSAPSCGEITPDPVPPDPTPVVIEDCAHACEVWRRFDMPQGRSTPLGAPCEEWCAIADEIPAYHQRVACVARSTTREQAESCP
jgi:hypothetical protein